MADWRDFLRDASWRNCAFGVLSAEARAGRAKAIHDYPFRDDVWVEDLGKAPRRFTLTGFLCGDDVVARMDEMVEAVEVEGPGELVHPHFGIVECDCLDFSAGARWDLGRVVELQFLFIQGGARIQPGFGAATSGLLESLSSVMDAESLSDFGTKMGGVLSSGSAVIRSAQTTIRGYTNIAQRLAGDATSVLRSVSGVASAFGVNMGRFNRGINAISTGNGILARVNNVAAAVTSRVNGVVTARSNITRSISNVNRLAGML